MLLLSIPAVQTRLGKYATKKINEKHDTNINIERVGLQFNGDVELKDIVFKLDQLSSALKNNININLLIANIVFELSALPSSQKNKP